MAGGGWNSAGPDMARPAGWRRIGA